MKNVVALNSVQLPAELGADNVQWVHVIPAGTVFGRDGRGPFKLMSAHTVMENTRKYHGSTKMVVDFEHQSIKTDKSGQPAPAAGWIVGLQSRPDGIWGKVEWTAAAATAIREKAYRYLSPVFLHSPDGEIHHVINVGLTNVPNLDLVALATTELQFMDPEQDMAALRQLLGLSHDADFDAILAAVKTLQLVQSANSATPNPAQYVPIGEYTRAVKEANSLRQGVTQQTAVSHVEEHIKTGKLAPFMKDWAISLCTTNMPAFDSFMAETGPAFNSIVSQSRATAMPPGGAAAQNSHQLSDDEQAVCKVMGVTPDQFIKARA